MQRSPRILLVSNYAHDQQQSMQRFASMLLDGLNNKGIEADMIAPKPFFGRLKPSGRGIGKWLGYIDKYLLFPRCLKRLDTELHQAGQRAVFHICDHSNAMYASAVNLNPVVVTCHDLLAVRGAFGDRDAWCSAARAGKFLQRWILNSLSKADAIACVSHTTFQDLQKLSPVASKKGAVVSLGLNSPFKELDAETCRVVFKEHSIDLQEPFLLHVGSSLPRKNRKAVIETLRLLKGRWKGSAVFAGESLTDELRSLAREYSVIENIREIERPSHMLLNALYSAAYALIFPSYAEGFGWPVLEAFVAGCPVITSNRTSLPEVAGEAAILVNPEDYKSMADAVVALENPATRKKMRQQGLLQSQQFDLGHMISEYQEIYNSIGQDRRE
jgi:glycosyltransferase involved in cell wall biosynthesis